MPLEIVCIFKKKFGKYTKYIIFLINIDLERLVATGYRPDLIYPTPPLVQDMTHGQFFSGV